MKKKMIALLAGALLTLSTSSAFAYFGGVTGNQFDLVRVVYDSTGSVEVATDLGNVTSVSGASASASDFSLSQFGTGKAFSNLNVAYFAYDNVSRSVYFSSTSTPPNILGSGITNFLAAAQNASALYNSLGGTTGTVVVADKTNTLSYFNQFDTTNGYAVGSMANMLSTNSGEANLAALASTGYVDVTLYKYSQIPATTRGTVTPSLTTLNLRTMADGSTVVNPTATPIPAAAYLLGSGLMGLFGLRRKQRA